VPLCVLAFVGRQIPPGAALRSVAAAFSRAGRPDSARHSLLPKSSLQTKDGGRVLSRTNPLPRTKTGG
jgi:hypothetical protein